MENLLIKLQEYVYPYIEDNIILYFICSIIYYSLGGIDESILTLFVLQILYILSLLLTKKSPNINNICKVYIIIIIGVICDNALKLSTTKMRTYLIIYYSYNQLVDVINVLSDTILIPPQLLEIIKKIKRK